MTTIHVVPAAGRMVPDPELGKLLPEAGRRVVKTQYWARRIADGDVTIIKARPAAAAGKKGEA